MAGAAAPFYLEKRMRSFVYLSSAKLELLYAHVPESLKKRTALSFGISIPVLPLAPRLGAEVRPPSTNEVTMLAAVLAHLDESGDIGTVARPRGYFAGQMTLRWGSSEEFLFLSGSAQRTLVALTGSNRHLIGHFDEGLPTVSYPASASVSLYRGLNHVFAGDEEQSDDVIDLVTRLALSHKRGPQETLEFVARRLARGEGFIDQGSKVPPDLEHLRQRRFLVRLGTPLYLAYTD
jgi:hypothetical protein